MKLYIARFKHAKGRYLVTTDGYGFQGQKIASARQERYGNKPDPVSGLYLYESHCMFGRDELVSLKLHKDTND